MPKLDSLVEISTSSSSHPHPHHHLHSHSHLLDIAKNSFPNMSTHLFLKLLFSGIKTFEAWNLYDVDFAQIDREAKQINGNTSIFSGINFSYAIFPILLIDLDFSYCKFIGANLKKADLTQSVLNSADLSHANLNQAELSDAKCIEANFFNATLKHVKGTHVNFSKANLKQVKLNGASLIESVFIDADLTNAELSLINLEGSDLTRTNLFQAMVDNAKLIETIWFGSYLKNVNFIKSDLTGANLEHSNLQESVLIRAKLQEAQLMDADLFGANLPDSNLHKADLSRANLTKAIFHFANLDYANLRGAKLNGMSLLHTNVTGVNLETTPIDQVNLNHRRPWYGPTDAWSLVKEENLKKYPIRIPIFALTSQESPTAFLSRCLPTQWDPPSDCEIFWNDVDRVVANHTCAIDQIVVKSESLMSEIRNSKETKRQQWLQLAEAVKLIGNVNVVNTVKDLIKFEKIAVLLPKYKQYIVSRSEELKNSTTVKNAFLNFKEKTILHRELLFIRPIDLEPISENKNTVLIFNTTLFDINTFSITKNNASYAISIDFLSNEIRELLEITQAISIYKWLSSLETLFFYQLKSDSNLIESSRNWLRGTLNASEYSNMLIKYPEVFSPCQRSCVNLTVSNQTLIRYMLTQLVSPVNFKKPIVNFVRNFSIVPYKTVLKFSNAELMLEDEQNWLGHITSHLSITEIIDSYFKVVNRLNTSLMVTNPATHEVIMLGSSKDQQFNHLNYACRVVGGEKLVISGYDKFNFTQLPLPSVTVHGSKETGTRLIDFRILARQIQKNFNSNLDVKLVPDNNDLIIQRFFQISSATNKKNIPVISVHLKNALVDRWYQKVEIILNTAPTKITGRGLKMQLKPIPYPFPTSNSSVDFLSLARLEKNSAVIIPAWMDHDSLFRVEDSLIITNALTRGLEWEKLYFLVLWDLDKQPEKAFTHTLEFTDKKVVIREKLNERIEGWDYSLNQHKKNLYAMATQVGIRDGYVMRDKDACREREYFSSYDVFRFRRSALHVGQTAKKVDHTTTNAKFNLTKALTETYLVIFSKKAKNDLEKIEIMIPLPVSAWITGLISAHFDYVGEIYQEKCPSLPAYMTYGFKPFLSALISSACNYVLFDQDEEIEEKFARFFTYFMLNFLGVIVGQPLTQKIAETIHNKLMCFFVQSLTWALLWNPSLFASEYLEIIPVVCMQLLQGLFFKTGEETYALTKKTCNSPSSFWRKKAPKSADEDQVLNNGEIKQMQVAFA